MFAGGVFPIDRNEKCIDFPKGSAQRDAWILAVKRGGWTPASKIQMGI